MKVVLFGPSGQIGRLLPAAFAGHSVTAFGRDRADIRDRAAVRRVIAEADPDSVILAAGLAGADFCEDHPGDAYAVNADGARNVAEASRERHFTHFSTDHVFDGKSGPYSEEDKPNPLSVYGRTKLESERIVLAVHPRCLVVRTTLVFNLQPGGRNFFMKLLGAKETVPCWTDHTATYTYGPRLAEAVAELVSTGATGVWNISGTELLNRHEFALAVARRFGLDETLFRAARIHDAPPRAPRPLRAGLRVDKARAALRTKMLSVEDSIELAYRSYGGRA